VGDSSQATGGGDGGGAVGTKSEVNRSEMGGSLGGGSSIPGSHAKV